MTDQPIETQVALMRQELKAMSDESRHSRAGIKRKIEDIETDVSAMKQQAAKWKGGLMVLVGIGGFFVGIISAWEKMANAFRG